MSLRDGPLGDIKVPLTWSAVAALVIAGIIAAGLLMSGRRDAMKAQAYDTARHAVDAVAAPVGGVLGAPLQWTHSGLGYVRDYLFAASENRKLKAELAKTQTWRDRLQMVELENARYRALLGVRTDPPLPTVFAHTVSDARGPFANTRLADVGADKGIVEGNPVLSEHGVVGRVVGVADHVSRILLLTDAESHVPVLIVRANGRAILSGDGGGQPKLDYVRQSVPLKEGDRVLTSGDGGVFPRGLPVGTVTRGFDGGWRVALDSDASPIDDVQILLFKDFGQLVNDEALAPKDLPTAMTEEPSQSIVSPAATPQTAVMSPASTLKAPAAAKAALRRRPLVSALSEAKPKAKPKAKPGSKPGPAAEPVASAADVGAPASANAAIAISPPF